MHYKLFNAESFGEGSAANYYLEYWLWKQRQEELNRPSDVEDYFDALYNMRILLHAATLQPAPVKELSSLTNVALKHYRTLSGWLQTKWPARYDEALRGITSALMAFEKKRYRPAGEMTVYLEMFVELHAPSNGLITVSCSGVGSGNIKSSFPILRWEQAIQNFLMLCSRNELKDWEKMLHEAQCRTELLERLDDPSAKPLNMRLGKIYFDPMDGKLLQKYFDGTKLSADETEAFTPLWQLVLADLRPYVASVQIGRYWAFADGPLMLSTKKISDTSMQVVVSDERGNVKDIDVVLDLNDDYVSRWRAAFARFTLMERKHAKALLSTCQEGYEQAKRLLNEML